MKNFKGINRYNALFQITALLFCGLSNAFLFNENSSLLLIIPAISWPLALIFPIRTFVKDKDLAYWMFPMSIFILYPFVISVCGILGLFLLLISPALAFPLFGAFGAFCSYYLFSKFVLLTYSSKDALFIMILGYLSILGYIYLGNLDKNGIRIDWLLGYWQPVVGIGLSIIFDRQMRKIETSTNHQT